MPTSSNDYTIATMTDITPDYTGSSEDDWKEADSILETIETQEGVSTRCNSEEGNSARTTDIRYKYGEAFVRWEEIKEEDKPVYKMKWGRSQNSRAEHAKINLLVLWTGMSRDMVKESLYADRIRILDKAKLNYDKREYPRGPPGYIMPFDPRVTVPKKPFNYEQTRVKDEMRLLDHKYRNEIVDRKDYEKQKNTLNNALERIERPTKSTMELKPSILSRLGKRREEDEGRGVQHQLKRLQRTPTVQSTRVNSGVCRELTGTERIRLSEPMRSDRELTTYTFGRNKSAKDISIEQSVEWENHVLKMVNSGELIQSFASVQFTSMGDARIPLNLAATNHNGPHVVQLDVALRMQEDFIRSYYTHSDPITRRELLQTYYWLGEGHAPYSVASRSHLFPFYAKANSLGS